MSKLSILYEDNHCLAVVKPTGWLTMGDQTGDRTLLDVAKDYIKSTYNKPGAVFLGVVHRLDRPVSGVVLFARTSKAASRLSAQFRDHTVEKVYWAAVTGNVSPPEGVLEDSLIKDERTNLVRVAPSSTPTAQACRLAYRRIRSGGGVTVVEIRPETGRSHQIRVQLAHRGWPIVGDQKYGSPLAWQPGQIALLARSLTFTHPVTKLPVTVTCDPPESWRTWH
ncbi:RluA family pseudouridine synthase [bacterium]|nr:RluA family pseudouridine synthase [bacterium]